MLFTLMPAANQPSKLQLCHVETFAHFAAYFQNHKSWAYAGKKGKTPEQMHCFSPAEFGKKTKIDETGQTVISATNDNVVAVHFGVLDFDGVPFPRLMQQLQKFNTVDWFGYTTFSHGTKQAPDGSLAYSFRLVLPFDRPAQPEEWPDVWHGLSKLVENINDETCFDLRRIYFLPATHIERDHLKIVLRNPFEAARAGAMSVNTLKGWGSTVVRKATKHAVVDKEELSVVTLSKDDLIDLASELRKSKRSSQRRNLGKVLTRIVEGTVYATEGRDEILFKLCGEIAQRFPNADPESVALLFDQSIGATCSAVDGNPTEDHHKVVEKFIRQREKKLGELSERIEEKHLQSRHNIREAFKPLGIERDTPYSDAELLDFAEESDVSVSELKRRWIISYGKACYLMVGGKYKSPVMRDELPFAAKRDLAPAVSAGVDVGDEDSAGLMKPVDIIARYGTLARRAVCDFTATKTYYDADEQTIYEATCPIRLDEEHDAEYVPWVATWLQFLGGDKHSLLLDWISVVTHLERPATILYMKGPKGVGKSSFGHGLSMLWTKQGATNLGSAFGNWNDVIATCPFLMADEVMPQELRRAPSTVLREFSQNTNRKIRKRFMSEIDTKGALRIALFANNIDILHTEENLTTDDIAAFSQRLLLITPDPRTADLLAAFKNMGLDFRKEVYQYGALARHALHLKKERMQSVLNRNERFLVEDHSDNELMNAMIAHTGVRSAVLQWIVCYLQRPDQAKQIIGYKVLVMDGEVFVSSEGISTAWGSYMDRYSQPDMKRVGQALKGISHGDARVLPLTEGGMTRFFHIRKEVLFIWASSTGYSSEQEIRQGLAKSTLIPRADQPVVALFNQSNGPAKEVGSLTDFGMWKQAKAEEKAAKAAGTSNGNGTHV